MIERVTIHELIRKARELARRMRDDISNAGLQPDDFEGIAQHFGLTLCWAQLPNNNPGCYLKRERKIVLNTRIQLAERLYFTFDHELMHDGIEHDDDLLSLLADAYIPSEETIILKGCTKTTFDPLRAASNLAAKASCARESLPQLSFVALHTANLGQLLKDMPFFFVRKTLLECSLFVADTLATGGEAGR